MSTTPPTPKCRATIGWENRGGRLRDIKCRNPATTTWVYTTIGYRMPVCEEHARELREKNTPNPEEVKL